MKKKSLSKSNSIKEQELKSSHSVPHALKEKTLAYNNIFEAVDKDKAALLKENSDLLIVIRDVLAANKISNSVEHQFALKRIEQLWGAKPCTALGKELNKLADIVCKYEEQFLS